jgi:hypothetical protein
MSQEDMKPFEDVIWLEVIECMGENEEELIQPTVYFLSDEELAEHCHNARADACFELKDNAIPVHNKWQEELFELGWLLRHEYTHSILYQRDNDLTHNSIWFTQSGLCIHF